jgi:hypothetical protein
MKMTPGSWKIYMIDARERKDGLKQAYVVADMLESGREWPLTIHDPKNNVEYKFECNEVMQDWMVGNCGGHAKYVEIRK